MPSPQPNSRRVGATRPADVPRKVVEQLHRGETETVTLAELLAVDLAAFGRSSLPEVPARRWREIDPGAGITKRMAVAATIAREELGDSAFGLLSGHRSDIARGIAALVLGEIPELTVAARLAQVRPLADDPHSGVREWAWMGLRPRLAAEIDSAIALLAPWTADVSANIRRFATESTRPRGVWCAHIAVLKTDPARGIALLEPLKADPSKYVQDSVSNWLNDASKSRPEWVRKVCRDWARASHADSTSRIIRRALRSID